mmetsp:Transcript_65640/g.154404  ORF Transcript_65640/g.154404 Transcript_65640/m.154404 type:complete len:607 (-) Transcript_65640:149-1969(-)
MRAVQPELDEKDCEEIFAETVSVHITPHGRDEYVAQLTVRLRPDNPAHPRNLLLELTDENDLLFYHSLAIGEGDYHALRAEMKLNVDFQSFPEQLADLLRRCTKEAPGAPSSGKMLACLDCSAARESLFSIIESNIFRQLTHVALQLRQGSDEVVKKHLAHKLRAAKMEVANLSQRLTAGSEALAESRQKVNELTARARVVADERTHLEESLQATHQRELSALRQEHARILAELQRSAAEERTRTEAEHKQALRAALDRAQSAESSVEELRRTGQSLTATGESCRERLEATERQLLEASQETAELRKQLKQLEEQKFRNEREISEMQVQLVSLKEQLTVRAQHSSSQASQIEEAMAQRRVLEDSLAEVRKQALAFEEKFNASVQEIAKGNKYIKSLVQASKEAKAKLRIQAADITQHEKTHLELRKAEELQKHILAEKDNELLRGKAREEKLQQDLEDLKRQLVQADDVMKSNQEVIEYLNRQVTARDLKALPEAATWNQPDATSFRVSNTNSVIAELLGQVEGITAGTKKSSSFTTATGFSNLSGLSSTGFLTPSPAKASVPSTAMPMTPSALYSPKIQDEDPLRKPVVYRRPGAALDPALAAVA